MLEYDFMPNHLSTIHLHDNLTSSYLDFYLPFASVSNVSFAGFALSVEQEVRGTF